VKTLNRDIGNINIEKSFGDEQDEERYHHDHDDDVNGHACCYSSMQRKSISRY